MIGFAMNGVDSSDFLGCSGTAGAFDIDADGFDDVIAGSEFAGPDLRGEAYVVFGGTDFPTEIELSLLGQGDGFVLSGAARSGRLGSWASAGDVNADGVDDLILGARDASPHNVDEAGEAYVVFGSPDLGGRYRLDSLNGVNGFILRGSGNDDGTGVSVDSAGDFNGDGRVDLLIGSVNATVDPDGVNSMGAGPGAAYIVLDPARPELELTVVGDCPGEITAVAAFIDPESPAAVFRSSSLGDGFVGPGPCAGTLLNLEEPEFFVPLSASLNGDAGGLIVTDEAMCGEYWQLIELFECRTGEPVRLPDSVDRSARSAD